MKSKPSMKRSEWIVAVGMDLAILLILVGLRRRMMAAARGEIA